MSVQHNLELVQGMYEALNSQDLDAHDRYWHQDMIWHGPPGLRRHSRPAGVQG